MVVISVLIKQIVNSKADDLLFTKKKFIFCRLFKTSSEIGVSN